jgi:hypothetical protein
MSNTLNTSAAWVIAAVEIQEVVAVGSFPQKNIIAGTIRKLFTAGIIGKEID